MSIPANRILRLIIQWTRHRGQIGQRGVKRFKIWLRRCLTLLTTLTLLMSLWLSKLHLKGRPPRSKRLKMKGNRPWAHLKIGNQRSRPGSPTRKWALCPLSPSDRTIRRRSRRKRGRNQSRRRRDHLAARKLGRLKVRVKKNQVRGSSSLKAK
jgi:hypothetical protein